MSRSSAPARTPGKIILVVLLGALVAILAFIFYVGATGGGTSNRPATESPPAPNSANSGPAHDGSH